MAAPLGITGATGRVGAAVARSLRGEHALRLVVRDPSRLPADLSGEVHAVADYGDQAAAREALTGVETVFMVSAAESEHRVAGHRTFITAAAEAGVRHVVYTSFYNAAPDCTFLLGRDHFATEQTIRQAGLAFTFLRDNFYADELVMLATRYGEFRGPFGTGRLSPVAIRDVAAAAAAVLRDVGGHAGRTYDLTGPVSHTLVEIAMLITRATGAEVACINETLAEAVASREPYGAPDWLVAAWISTYTAIAAGEMDGVSADLPDLLGRPATPLHQVIADSETAVAGEARLPRNDP